MDTTPNTTLKLFFQNEGITGASAARSMGLTRAYINYLVRGQRSVTWNVYHRFERAYCTHTSPFYLPTASAIKDIIGRSLEQTFTDAPQTAQDGRSGPSDGLGQ